MKQLTTKALEGILVRLWNDYFINEKGLAESPDLWLYRHNLPNQIWFATPTPLEDQWDFVRSLPKPREIVIQHLGEWASPVQPYIKGWTVFIVREADSK